MTYAAVLKEARGAEDQLASLARLIHQESGRIQGLVSEAHRAGFKEACDRLGAPEADTPMDRIALAGGKIT